VNRLPRLWLLASIGWLAPGCGGKSDAPSPAEITERAWTAYEQVIAAGESAKTCAEAGTAMQAAFTANRQAFVDSAALDRDKQRVAKAADYVEKHDERYRSIEKRLDALEDRCGEEPTVAATFRQMEAP
jgi:hypothetical protein